MQLLETFWGQMCIDDHFRKEVFCLKKDFPRMSCQDVVFFGNIYGEPCRGKYKLVVFCCWNFVVLRNNEHCCQFFLWLNDLFGWEKFTKLSEKPNYSWYLSINFSQNLVFFGGRKIVFILVKKCSPNTVKVKIFPYIFPKNIHQI